MVKTLPEKGLHVIQQYRNLPIANTTVCCPYFKNSHNARGLLGVRAGKGTPEEIVDEVNELAHKKQIDLAQLSSQQIRDFLLEQGIGIDCSGLVVHVLRAVHPQVINQLHIDRGARNPLTHWLIRKIRPTENLSVKTLTAPENAKRIDTFHNAQPGDLIRTRNGDHVLMITQVKRNDSGVKEITYAHSTSYYGTTNGVREGSIVITNPQKSFAEQNWTEAEEGTGRNYTHKGYVDGGNDSGIFRLQRVQN